MSSSSAVAPWRFAQLRVYKWPFSCQQCGSARALLWNHSNEAIQLPLPNTRYSVVQCTIAVLHPISTAVLAILSSCRASVRNGGHARMEEDISSAFMGSSAAPGTIAGPILVFLPSNQQRSPFRRPAVSHSPQWWAHSNGGGQCLYPLPSSVCKSIVNK